MPRDSDRFSLGDLIAGDVVIIINTLVLPILFIPYILVGVIALLVVTIVFALVSGFFGLIIGSDTAVVRIIDILGFSTGVTFPHLIGTIILFMFYFNTNDGSDEDGVLSHEGKVGEDILSNLWWIGIPIISLIGIGALATGRVSLPNIFGTEFLTYLFLLASAFVLIIRLRGLYYFYYESLPDLRTFFISYFLLSGSVEALFYFSGVDYTGFIYEGSEVNPSEWGMATVYLPILAPVDILNELGIIDTTLSFLEDPLFFNSQTGSGFLLSLFIVFIGLPSLLYGVSFVVPASKILFKTGRSIANVTLNLLQYQVWPATATLCHYSYRTLLYIVFLRPQN